MDEQRLRELLDLAGREYNEGKYSEAIAHWQEALQMDPANQKAREGIRMAQLLVVNWESTEGEEEGQELSVAGGAADSETQEKIGFGISRVRELMGAGRIQEAVEGCQLLGELAPGMESVRRLTEEVTQVYEAQPFIKDRMERARKALAQGRSKEAAEEARNVLSVDHGNQEAQEILRRATGSAPPAPPVHVPSAFQVDKEGKPAPPSPFAVGPDADALFAQFEFEEPGGIPSGPQRAVRPEEKPGPGAQVEGDLGLSGPAGAAPIAKPDAAAQAASLLREGRALLDGKEYQQAIDRLAHVLALEPANAEAERLIDDARAKFEGLGRLVDEAYFRGIDFFESGNWADARRSFEEVISLHPDHPEAREYLQRIDEAAAAAPSPPAGMPEEASVPLAMPSPREEAPPPVPPAPKPVPAVSAGVIRKKPVQPVPRRGHGRIVAVAAIVAVVVIAAGAIAFFMLGGPEAEPAAVAARPTPGTEVLPVQPPPRLGAEAAGASAAGPGQTGDKPGPLEVLPGSQPPRVAAPAAPDPAAIRRNVEALAREGRGLMAQQKYTEAKAAFDRALALDPTNFDIEEMRAKAADAAAEQERFEREVEASEAAFSDGDWGGALYKLYRLREERRDMTILKTYIKNANYNWGIESLATFEIDAALEHFKDALEMDPGDGAIQRHVDVANRYKRRPRDTAFNAYVSKLRPRPIDQR